MTTPSLSIFIPAYNAATTLSAVVDRIPKDLWLNILSVNIINDGSTDQTASVVLAMMDKYPKLKLHSFNQNQGYGHAVRHGLTLCRSSGSDYSACIHADGQYPPEFLPQFLAHMQTQQIDLLQGSRHKLGTARDGGMPLYKIVAGHVLTWLENRCFGLALTDYHSGYLVYSRRAITTIPFPELSGYFDFDLEVIASAVAMGLKVGELAIPTRYAGEKSHLQPIRYGFRVLRVLYRYLRGRYAQRPEARKSL